MSDRPNSDFGGGSSSPASSTTTTASQNKRRSSFAGETFANLFGTTRRSSMSRGNSNSDTSNAGVQQSPSGSHQGMGPITSAATNARRLSMGAFGNMSTSPPQPSSSRREGSVTSTGSASGIEESAVEDEPGSASVGTSNLQMAFSRRMSSNARNIRDVRSSVTGGTSGSNNHQEIGADSPKEGFNWSENFRTRAERTSSIAAVNPPNMSSIAGMGGSASGNAGVAGHSRTKSLAAVEASSAKIAAPQQPDMAKPIAAKERPRPDHFQERILKGDFYMD